MQKDHAIKFCRYQFNNSVKVLVTGLTRSRAGWRYYADYWWIRKDLVLKAKGYASGQLGIKNPEAKIIH